ncbi:MAG: hypothetical protein COA45_06725 [Zetaproteobacteria bacterium]|nr:MAG: hypothetical protein COA45_06725 [Zetaproteobacteria bacterium]
MLGIKKSIQEFFSSSSLNVLLLQRTLNDHDVSEDVVSAVIDDLAGRVKDTPLNKEMLTDVFSKHELGEIASETYEELKNDSVVLPYGSIACP